jgi:hypothetical protein
VDARADPERSQRLQTFWLAEGAGAAGGTPTGRVLLQPVLDLGSGLPAPAPTVPGVLQRYASTDSRFGAERADRAVRDAASASGPSLTGLSGFSQTRFQRTSSGPREAPPCLAPLLLPSLRSRASAHVRSPKATGTAAGGERPAARASSLVKRTGTAHTWANFADQVLLPTDDVPD